MKGRNMKNTLLKEIGNFMDFSKYFFLIILLLIPLFYELYIYSFYHMDEHIVRFFNHDYGFISILLQRFFKILWGMITFLLLREAIFMYLTDGRFFIKETLVTKKGFFSLLKFYKKADANKIRVLDLPELDWTKASGAIIARIDNKLIYKPTDGDGENSLIAGIPGTGKTDSCAKTSAARWGMTPGMKASKKNQHAGCYVIDYKGDISLSTKSFRNILFFEPEHPETSCHFDPFEGIYSMKPEVRSMYLEKLSSVLLPDSKSSNGDGQYFIETGRNFFVGAAQYYLGLEGHENATFPDVVNFIIHTNCVELVTNGMNSNNEEAKKYLASYYKNNEKNLSGSLSELVKKIRTFTLSNLYQILNSNGRTISTKDLDAGMDVYVRISLENKANYYSLVSLVTMQFLNNFAARSEDPASKIKLKPVLMILDELPAMKLNFEFLSESLSLLRSKKVSCMLLCQNIGQLKTLYGDSFTDLLGTIHIKAVLSVSDNFTRSYFSENAGTHDYFTESSTYTKDGSSKTISVKEGQPIFRPADFGNLTDKSAGRYEAIVIIYGRCAKATLCNFNELKTA